jgi:hypothetical protein
LAGISIIRLLQLGVGSVESEWIQATSGGFLAGVEHSEEVIQAALGGGTGLPCGIIAFASLSFLGSLEVGRGAAPAFGSAFELFARPVVFVGGAQ